MRTVTIKEDDDKLKVAKGSQKIDVARKIDIKAGDELKITVGQSSFVMKKDGTVTIKGQKLNLDFGQKIKGKGALGVELNGLQIKLNADTQLELKASAMAKVKGAMVDIDGSGMAKLKGGITMIG